jgi:hypothetical protein
MDDNLLYLEGLADGISYYGQVSLQTTATVSIATASVYQTIPYQGNLDSEVYGLTLSTNFGLKNISGNTILLDVFGYVDLEDGNNKEYGLKFAKNGSLINQTEARAESGNSHTLVKLVTNWMVELEDDDEIEMYITNYTSSGNVIVGRPKMVANTVAKTDMVGTAGTQSFTYGFPLFSDLFDYALNISGTYSDFTYAKTATFSSIVNSQDFNSGTVSNVIGPTTSVYNGLLTTDLTGGTNLVDVIAANIVITEGPVPADDVAYQYFFHLNTTDAEYHYEFIEMATHSNIRYAHYFNVVNITGRSGGAIELDFDGVTVTTQFGSGSLFSTNVP